MGRSTYRKESVRELLNALIYWVVWPTVILVVAVLLTRICQYLATPAELSKEGSTLAQTLTSQTEPFASFAGVMLGIIILAWLMICWFVVGRIGWQHYRNALVLSREEMWSNFQSSAPIGEATDSRAARKHLSNACTQHPLSAIPGNWECISLLADRLATPPTTSS